MSCRTQDPTETSGACQVSYPYPDPCISLGWDDNHAQSRTRALIGRVPPFCHSLVWARCSSLSPAKTNPTIGLKPTTAAMLHRVVKTGLDHN